MLTSTPTVRPRLLLPLFVPAAALVSMFGLHSARAQAYTEAGDAGQTLATAVAIGRTAGTTLPSISGTIGTSTDADLYSFMISNTTTFAATATSTAGIDTSLFLFTLNGTPVIANDDQSNTNFQARIAAGNSLLTTLPAGTYYLGISLSGNEPVNLNNQLLFTTDQPTTNVRGAASGLNPATESTFNGNTFFAETGAYTITFAVPEPSTWALVGTGAVMLGVVMIRRRQSVA